MKVILAGSRHIKNYVIVCQAIQQSGFDITEIVSGGADGVDKVGELYASGHRIPIKRFPANWSMHGRAAGPIRNDLMAAYADALICVWDWNSKGSKHMIGAAKKRGLKVYVHLIPEATPKPA